MEIDIEGQDKEADNRLRQLVQWVRSIDGFEAAAPRPASEDASFRRYFRFATDAHSYIVMDAPPSHEDCEPFMRISGWLDDMQLNAPRVLHKNLQQGYLVLTDLGTTQFLIALREDNSLADQLYGDALRSLAVIQQQGIRYQDELPVFDRNMMLFELSLFRDWLCERLLGIRFSEEQIEKWDATCELSIANVLSQPQTFVHRDYHSRNLMLTGQDNPGILDFQDAAKGPYTYDLVSLLKDCYIAWPQQRVRGWVDDFCQLVGIAEAERANFMRHFELTGIQRHLKAAGIFARLKLRDGKGDFVFDIPRTLGYVLDIAPRYPELDFLARLIGEQILPALESQQQ